MRISYEDFFVLPEGAEITELICTTMSMDIREQLKILGCRKLDEHVVVSDDYYPVLCDFISNSYFFFDADKTSVACPDFKFAPRLVAALYAMQYPVTVSTGVFHPKIMLLRYVLAGEVYYRLQVSSRNLTAESGESTFEVGVQLLGKKSGKIKAKNHNLDELLVRLADYVKDGQDKKKKDRVSEIAKELKDIVFVLPAKPESDILVSVSGFGQRQDAALVEQWESENNRNPKRLYILSPDYETKKEQIEIFHRVYAPVWENAEESTDSVKESKWRSTHAKLYWWPDKKTVWLGSCNSSDAAMYGANVECMIRITDINDEITVEDERDTLYVFGIKCERVTEGKEWSDNEEYNLIRLLNRFAERCVITGEDKKITYRKPKVTIKVTDEALDVIEKEEENPELYLECLPLGMEEEVDGKTKWKRIERVPGLIKYSFDGRRSEGTNGVLRIRLTQKLTSREHRDIGISVEKHVTYDESALQRVSQINPAYNYQRFVGREWLELLMRVDNRKKMEELNKSFHDNLELVEKIESLTEEQKRYLRDMKVIYESVAQTMNK